MDKKTENIYEFYEKHISPLTPSIADNINRSLITYKKNDIKAAIMIAVNSNIRTWKYISAVLHRREKEGGVNNNGNGRVFCYSLKMLKLSLWRWLIIVRHHN